MITVLPHPTRIGSIWGLVATTNLEIVMPASTPNRALDANSVEAQVTALNAGWYNVVTQAMGISDPNFQLAQGTLGLQTSDSSGLFLMADSCPEDSAVAYYDPSGLSKRSSGFQMLLSALLPEGGTTLTTVLGDMYPAWITFKTAFYTANPTTSMTPLQIFTSFANQKLDPGLASKATNTFLQAANAPLNQALAAMASPASMQTFLDSAQNSYNLYKYSDTIVNAQGAINNGGSAQINFDSSTMNTTLNSTFAEGGASGYYGIFSGGASASFQALDTTAAQSRVTVTGSINKFATLAVNPLNWFTSSEYLRAYNGKNDNTIWDPAGNSGGWDAFFGPTGQLASRVDQLLLVSDYDITVTSMASYSAAQYQQIKAQASFGVWPFFSAHSSATHTTDYSQNAAGNLVVRHVLAKGLIQVWGAIVQDAPK